MTHSPASASGDQPPAGTGLTARDLTARMAADGELTAEDIAGLARLDDGPDATDDCWDNDLQADPDAEPPAGWLVLPDDEHAALLDGGTGTPQVAEALDAGFTRRYAAPGATGFAGGGPLDVMLPGSDLAWHAAQARRRGLATLSDNELCGVLGSARKLSSWAAELELATVTELDARRAGPGGRPGEHVAEEVGAVLTLTPRAASDLIGLARNLARLPQTRALLAAGILDQDRAEVIADALAVLDAAGAAAVDRPDHTQGRGQDHRAAARRLPARHRRLRPSGGDPPPRASPTGRPGRMLGRSRRNLRHRRARPLPGRGDRRRQDPRRRRPLAARPRHARQPRPAARRRVPRPPHQPSPDGPAPPALGYPRHFRHPRQPRPPVPRPGRWAEP